MTEFKELQNYGTDANTDRLVTSDDAALRLGAAEMGYGLNYLLAGETDEKVLLEIANQGYGLETILTKEYFPKNVKDAAKECLKEHGYKDVREWAEANPKRVHNNDLLEEI